MQSIIIVDDMNEHIQYIKNIIQDMSYSFRIQTFHNIQAFQSQIQQFDDDAIIIMDILLGQNDVLNWRNSSINYNAIFKLFL